MRVDTRRRKPSDLEAPELSESFSNGERRRTTSVKLHPGTKSIARQPAKTGSKKTDTIQRHLETIAQARKSKLPAFVRPQLATLVDSVPQGAEWLHEIKFDGYRALCRIDEGRAVFLTREGQDWTSRFGSLVEAARNLPVRRALLDGEVVALEEDGKTNFQLLQNSLKRKNSATLVYFVFDLLYLDGWDLTRSPLRERKNILQQILKPKRKEKTSNALRCSEHWIGHGAKLFEESCRQGLEEIGSALSLRPRTRVAQS